MTPPELAFAGAVAYGVTLAGLVLVLKLRRGTLRPAPDALLALGIVGIAVAVASVFLLPSRVIAVLVPILMLISGLLLLSPIVGAARGHERLQRITGWLLLVGASVTLVPAILRPVLGL